MLDLAINHTDEVVSKFRTTWYKDRYKFFHATPYYDDWHPEESTWTNHQFVSVRGNEVIGYIGYTIDRADGDIAHGLCIMNFEEKPSATFSIDLGKTLRDIFEKYRFRKLRFSVIVGNPIEKSYDKMCLKYGGRIVGVSKENVKLIDGKFYDEKFYEVMRSDYMNATGKGRKAAASENRSTKKDKTSAEHWLSEIRSSYEPQNTAIPAGIEMPNSILSYVDMENLEVTGTQHRCEKQGRPAFYANKF